MTIWVAQEPRGEGVDLNVLRDWDRTQEIRFVFTKTFNISQHPHEAMAAAETFAAQFDFKRDRWVMAGGDPLAGVFCTIALTREAAAVGARTFGSLRFIRERDQQGNRTIPQYIPVEVPIGT